MSTTPATPTTPGPYSGTSLPATTPAAEPPDKRLPPMDEASPEGQQPAPGEENPCGLNSALEAWPAADHGPDKSDNAKAFEEFQAEIEAVWEPKPADDGPPWIPHDGGPCPLKDEEVEEWEWKMRDGSINSSRGTHLPSKRHWSHADHPFDILEYRVTKPAPGHGPKKAPNPWLPHEPGKKVELKETFTAHGKVWTRHTPGDPCPCDTVTLIDVLMDDEHVCKNQYIEFASTWNNIIGWRYADPAPAAPTEAAAKPRHGWPMDDLLASMGPKKPAKQCPHCGEPEIEAMTPRTVYACGSSDYDQRPGSFKVSDKCLAANAAQPWTPKPGDVVRLKSGGPEMTVTGIFNCPKAGYHAALAWFDNGRFGTLNATFPALQPAKEEAQP